MPAHRPAIAYSHIVWRLTLMPASRAASRLPPMATVRRPNVVRLRITQPSAATIAKIQIKDVDADDVGIHEADESAVFDDERAPLGEDLGEPAGGDQHRKGGHERDDIAVGDHDAVDQARTEPDRERDHDHHDPVRLVGEVLDRRQGRHDRGETQDRADRQVDAARDDDQGHADADDTDDRCLAEDHQRVAEGGEALTGGDGAHDHERAAARGRVRGCARPSRT